MPHGPRNEDQGQRRSQLDVVHGRQGCAAKAIVFWPLDSLQAVFGKRTPSPTEDRQERITDSSLTL